ncbi:hypothetical protein, partial [Streptomyces aureocirculatus]|uniref:hypothetical protein n=1 Tax=Streptomyces aureocirculatus TaxID=67275 RepID=UPI0004C59911
MSRNPYGQTREDLLHRKATDGTRPPMARPHQPGLGWDKQDDLAAVFAAQHPDEYKVATTGYWRNTERPWQRCWPHRVLIPAGHDPASGPAPIISTLTFRTTPKPLDEKGWGPDGSTKIPLADYDHHQWLLDTYGLCYGYVIAYSSHDTETRTYRIR